MVGGYVVAVLVADKDGRCLIISDDGLCHKAVGIDAHVAETGREDSEVLLGILSHPLACDAVSHGQSLSATFYFVTADHPADGGVVDRLAPLQCQPLVDSFRKVLESKVNDGILMMM